jgi:hypothetical protein
MQRIVFRALVCQLAVVAVFVFGASAQSSVCQIFVQNLKPDVLIQGSSFQQFSQLQQLVASSTYASWGNASSSSLNGGLDIPGEVDAFLGTSSNASNWGANRSQFLSMTAQSAYAGGANNTVISQMSVAALKVVDDCAKSDADMNGFSARLKTVSDNRDSFAVLLTNTTKGNPQWALTEFSAQPLDPQFKCNDDLQDASLAHPKPISTQTLLIHCSKDPEKHFTLGIQTTAGAASEAFTITSVHEEIQKLRDDTTAQIQELAAKLDKHGLVVAFAASTCPAPWTVYQPAQGRFIRGLDPSGANDPDGALRSVGSVQSDGVANHTHTMGVKGGDSTTMVPGGATQRLPNFVNDGWGGGPKKETDPNTNGISETRPKNVALLFCTLP